jgi:Holliday junction resolvase-like predicted endonuclease
MTKLPNGTTRCPAIEELIVLTTEIGRRAERAAKVYLEMRGFQVLELNWRRPRSEIDIVAEKDQTKHFVEVKYRHDDQQGGGLEAITPSKLRHMERAADAWVEENKYQGEYVLSAIEIGGPEFAVLSFVENSF